MLINVTQVKLLWGHGTTYHTLKDLWNSSVLRWVRKVSSWLDVYCSMP